jgi:hypothetical protein
VAIVVLCDACSSVCCSSGGLPKNTDTTALSIHATWKLISSSRGGRAVKQGMRIQLQDPEMAIEITTDIETCHQLLDAADLVLTSSEVIRSFFATSTALSLPRDDSNVMFLASRHLPLATLVPPKIRPRSLL